MRYGLEKPVEIDLTGKIYHENSLWHKLVMYLRIL
jgi:hypothetical protein